MSTVTARIGILAVDDHPMVREGIAALIAMQPDMIWVAEASASSSPATITMRPDLAGDPNSGPGTIRQWFNTAVYSAPPAGSGRLGNSRAIRW